MYTIHLAKEPFKFSCSHFTILAKDRAERLHGHNYQVRVRIEVTKVDRDLGLAFDFNQAKPLIRAFCEELDERILIPKDSPYLKIEKLEAQIKISFAGKSYSFPETDCALLPLVNITAEELSRLACERFLSEFKSLPHWSAIEVDIEETRGQSVSYKLSR
jgi:6-pyruvoyltetrahydropterin/6-carboxytetrahydropterin synthase